MVRLNNPRREILTRKDFEQYPVWTWDDKNEGYLPISETEPSPENYWGLFIKARFDTPDGYSFDGFLVGDKTFHAFGLFIHEDDIMFNINLPDLNELALLRLKKLLKINSLKLFPIRYKSIISFKDGSEISGTLNFPNS